MVNEVWKDIKGYEGLYQVSNYGKVKSLKRKVYSGKNRFRWHYERIMSNKKNNGNGYIVVSLNKNGRSQNKYVHRLVAEAFIENPNNLKYINHKDETKSNNNVKNLEWCTAEYNCKYNDRHKKIGLKMINNKGNSKPIYQLNDNNEVINQYPSISEASRQLKVSYQAISDCLKGKQQHSAGYRWKYLDNFLS